MLARPVNRARKALAQSFPAPVGGWNARDALSAMAPTDAVRLDNLFPNYGKVSLRNGFASFATGLGAEVKTLAEFNAGSSRKMIAAANGHIWDVSSAGAATSLAAGFSENAWQCAQFDDASGGARMGMVNGTDAPQIYNGTTIAAMTVSGSGLTVANLINIHVHNNRSYFIEKNSQNFWYSAVNALGGVLTKFPLGRLSGFGGNVIAMGTWSADAGDGPQDLAVFLTSAGDVIVFSGSDPSTAIDWGLVGIYRIGEPIGYRALAKVGAELFAITKAGYIPMSQAARMGLDKQAGIAISNKIQSAAVQAAIANAGNSGWQAVLYPRGNYLLVNVPLSSSQFQQHVMNISDGSWCRFTGQDGYCWCVYNNRLYMGGDSVVYLADNGHADNGAAIQGDAQIAWNYLTRPGELKRVGMMRVIAQSDSPIAYSLNLGYDFRDPSSLITSTAGGSISTAPWDTSAWDTTAWPSDTTVFDAWTGGIGIGDAVSARLRVASSATGFDWFSTTFSYEIGGLL